MAEVVCPHYRTALLNGSKMNCLIINSYAGSLLVAAKQEGLRVIASMEDAGYGIGSQKLNFPNEVYVDKEPWPESLGDLTDAIAIMHPPCSCFSLQGSNANPVTRGTDSEAFKCTRKAVSYVMERSIKGFAIESVPATLEGARSYHNEMASKHGYNIYRVLLNAVTFGVPQWRTRFWAIFIRKDAASEKMWFHHRPVYRTVGEVLESVKPTDVIPGVERDYQKWRERLSTHNIPLDRVLNQENAYGSVPYLSARYLGWDLGGSKSAVEYKFVEQYHFSKFSSAWSIQLNPGGFTPTLMATSGWWLDGRPLTRSEYCAIAGFPTDYRFDKPREIQAYLSRGVAPPVARWIIQQLMAHLNQTFKPVDVHAVTDKYVQASPGETVDFRVSKKELKQKQLFDLHRKLA